MADIIQVRRDSAANWTAVNPILAEGEIGFERDTKAIKIGDGVAHWNSLSYTTGVLTAVDQPLTGTVNGINTIFTTPNNFDADSIKVHRNGQRLIKGSGHDYTVTGINQITFVIAPIRAILTADYIKL